MGIGFNSRNDILMIYLTEIQKLLGRREITYDVSKMLSFRRKGPVRRSAFALANLLLLSPVFIERFKAAITPADIVVAVLRLIKRRKFERIVSVREVIDEIKDFRREIGICEPEESHWGEWFNISLLLLIYTDIGGIHIHLREKPILRLPPRNIGYDSLFIEPEYFIPAIEKVWEG